MLSFYERKLRQKVGSSDYFRKEEETQGKILSELRIGIYFSEKYSILPFLHDPSKEENYGILDSFIVEARGETSRIMSEICFDTLYPSEYEYSSMREMFFREKLQKFGGIILPFSIWLEGLSERVISTIRRTLDLEREEFNGDNIDRGFIFPIILIRATDSYYESDFKKSCEIAMREGAYAYLEMIGKENHKGDLIIDFSNPINEQRMGIIIRLLVSYAAGADINPKREIFYIDEGIAVFYKIKSDLFKGEMKITSSYSQYEIEPFSYKIIADLFDFNDPKDEVKKIQNDKKPKANKSWGDSISRFFGIKESPPLVKRPKRLPNSHSQGARNEVSSSRQIYPVIASSQNSTEIRPVEVVSENVTLSQDVTVQAVTEQPMTPSSEVSHFLPLSEENRAENTHANVLQMVEVLNSPAAPLNPISALSLEDIREFEQDIMLEQRSTEEFFQNFQYSLQVRRESTLTDDEDAYLKSFVRNNRIMWNHLKEIQKDPVLHEFFQEILRCLSGIVLASKVINSERVDGNSPTRKVVDLFTQIVDGILSFANAPPLASAIANATAFVVDVVAENRIEVVSHRISRLFPDDSRVLRTLALVLTMHQADLIRNPPSLSGVNVLYKGYLIAVARFNGRESFTALDYLIANQVEKIINFWKKLHSTPAPLEKEWFPALLQELGIELDSNEISQMLERPVVPIPIPQLGAILTVVANSRQVEAAPLPSNSRSEEEFNVRLTVLENRQNQTEAHLRTTIHRNGRTPTEVGDDLVLVYETGNPSALSEQQRMQERIRELENEVNVLREQAVISSEQMRMLAEKNDEIIGLLTQLLRGNNINPPIVGFGSRLG